MAKSIIFKITFPNGKIYIGHDRTNSLTYFGTINDELVKKDFSAKQRLDFKIRKQVLKTLNTTDRSKVSKEEHKLIKKYKSNDPKIGYNRSPKYKR